MSTSDLGSHIPTRANWAEEAVRAHAGAEHLTREEQVLARIEKARARRPRIKAYLASPRRIPFNEEGIFRHYPELDG